MATPKISIDCQDCGKNYRVKRALIGKRFKCKQCGAVVPIRELEDTDHVGYGSAVDESSILSEPAAEETGDRSNQETKMLPPSDDTLPEPALDDALGDTVAEKDSGKGMKKSPPAAPAPARALSAEDAAFLHQGRIVFILAVVLAFLASVPQNYRQVRAMSIEGEIAEMSSDHTRPEAPERPEYKMGMSKSELASYRKARAEYYTSPEYKTYKDLLKSWQDERKGNKAKIKKLRKELSLVKIHMQQVELIFYLKLLAALAMLGGLGVIALKGSSAEQWGAMILMAVVVPELLGLNLYLNLPFRL